MAASLDHWMSMGGWEGPKSAATFAMEHPPFVDVRPIVNKAFPSSYWKALTVGHVGRNPIHHTNIYKSYKPPGIS